MRKISEVYRQRYSLLNKLYLIYPGIRFQAQNKARWTTYFGFHDYESHKFSPAIHYTMLPNEVCFDIDEPDVSNFEEVLNYLNDMRIPHIAGFSGSKGYHVHFLIKPKGSDIYEFATAVDVRQFTQTLTKLLIEDMEDVKGVDVQQVKHRKIRSFYSQHQKTGLWKMPFQDGYEYGYPVWELSHLWYRLVRKKLRESEEETLVRSKGKGKGKGDFSWVKEILDNPQRYNDYRRRIVMYALTPYLVNVKGIDDEETERTIMEWVEKTPRGDDNNFRGLVQSEIRSYRRSGYLPSKKSLKSLTA